MPFVIHLAAIVLQTVADDKIISMQQKIIDHNLVECLLLYLYRRSLIFNNHPRV